MNHKWYILIKFIIIGFIIVIGIDYINFDFKISNSNHVYGNSLVPKNVVISHIEKNDKILLNLNIETILVSISSAQKGNIS